MLHLTKRIVKTSKKEVYEHLGGLGVFNPNFDGNALAWYDGNLELTTAQWNDQGAGGHDIIFTGSPPIISGATPDRDAVRFNGIDELGQVATPPIDQPFTIYIVLNSIAWGANDRVFDDGVTQDQKLLFQETATPNLTARAGSSISSSPDLALGTFGIVAVVYNGGSSEIRTNLNAAVTGNIGTRDGDGITLASRATVGVHWNGEIGYLIIRDVADATSVQTNIITQLGAICGITV